MHRDVADRFAVLAKRSGLSIQRAMEALMWYGSQLSPAELTRLVAEVAEHLYPDEGTSLEALGLPSAEALREAAERHTARTPRRRRTGGI